MRPLSLVIAWNRRSSHLARLYPPISPKLFPNMTIVSNTPKPELTLVIGSTFAQLRPRSRQVRMASSAANVKHPSSCMLQGASLIAWPFRIFLKVHLGSCRHHQMTIVSFNDPEPPTALEVVINGLAKCIRKSRPTTPNPLCLCHGVITDQTLACLSVVRQAESFPVNPPVPSAELQDPLFLGFATQSRLPTSAVATVVGGHRSCACTGSIHHVDVPPERI
jgi:hypothetical protein